MAIKAETVFRRQIRQIKHTHDTAHRSFLVDKYMVEGLHGSFLTQITTGRSLDTQEFCDTLEQHPGEGTESRHRHARHLDERQVDKEQSTGQTEDHRLRQFNAIIAQQR